MRTIELSNLPDQLYAELEKLARVRGKPIDDVLVEVISTAFAGETESEARRIAELRVAREAMARRGVWIEPEEIQQAKIQGRE